MPISPEAGKTDFGLAIDPVQLPLHEPDEEREYRAPEGFVLFNGIRDATT
jgi:hypothetical protein